MFNNEELLDRLRKGESIDAIAKEISESLNKAEADYKAEVAAYEAEKEAAKNKEAKLQSHARIVAEAINALVAECFPDVDLGDDKVTADEVIGVVRPAMNFCSRLNELKNDTGKAKAKVKVFTNSADDVIADFLKSIGL